MDNFHHCGQVALFLKFTWIYINQSKKLIRINKVEVSGEGKVSCRNGMTFYKRMTEFNIISALSTVPEMAEKKLTQKVYMTLHQAGVRSNVRLVLLKL